MEISLVMVIDLAAVKGKFGTLFNGQAEVACTHERGERYAICAMRSVPCEKHIPHSASRDPHGASRIPS